MENSAPPKSKCCSSFWTGLIGPAFGATDENCKRSGIVVTMRYIDITVCVVGQVLCQRQGSINAPQPQRPLFTPVKRGGWAERWESQRLDLSTLCLPSPPLPHFLMLPPRRERSFPRSKRQATQLLIILLPPKQLSISPLFRRDSRKKVPETLSRAYRRQLETNVKGSRTKLRISVGR